MKVVIRKKTVKVICLVLIVIVLFFVAKAVVTEFFSKPKLIIKYPSEKPRPTPTKKPFTFFPYQTDSEVGFYKYSLQIPEGWIVRYRYLQWGDLGLFGKIQMDFILPQILQEKGDLVAWDDEIQWGGVFLYAYDPYSSIKEFVNAVYKEKADTIAIEEDGKIGKNTLYYISPKARLSSKDAITPRYVILGGYFSYEMEIYGKESDVETRLKKEIFPRFNFYEKDI